MRIGIIGGLVVLGQLAAGQAALAEEDALAAAVARNPDRFEARALDLVAGFGGPEGLTAEGIEAHVALERAAARATSLRRFHEMDLNADGSVDRDELTVSKAAAGAGTRGRMERQFLAADADGSGAVDPAEMGAVAQAAGLSALDEKEAAVLRALMRLDGDGDGALTAEELTEALSRMRQAG